MLEIIPQALNVQVSHFLEIVVLRFRRLLKFKPSHNVFDMHGDRSEVCFHAIPPPPSNPGVYHERLYRKQGSREPAQAFIFLASAAIAVPASRRSL